jgi:3-hydroxyacyl-CoA dehydrogenase
MGSGIALLLAQEMARARLQPENRDRLFRLNLVDVSDAALAGLMGYLRTQLVKAGEKSAVLLRDLFRDREDLVENSEIIDAYVQEALALCRCGTDPATAAGSRMVFEAIVENAEVKVEVLGRLKGIAAPDAWFFTNTSSIPIRLLDERIGLGGRIIGFHFYNPPAVQKLAELIAAERTLPELRQASHELAARLRKKIIPSRDIAGFIGNGHFMRDGMHALEAARRLAPEMTLPGALYALNRVSQDFLLRPMGIFQLIDYVGVDVFQCILKVMDEHIGGETLRDELIDALAGRKVLGGQRADGSQKDGFLQYERNRPAGVYDLESGQYRKFDPAGWSGEVDRKLGPLPAGHLPWKALLNHPAKEEKLAAYFAALQGADGLGATLAREYLRRSREIGLKLVADGVAAAEEDVNGVLVNGFFHLYGPIHPYLD